EEPDMKIDSPNYNQSLFSLTLSPSSPYPSSSMTVSIYAPLIKQFFDIGKEIVILYEKAEHNKEICSLLLQKYNCARIAVQDLDMRKTENVTFFSKKENYELFRNFIICMQRIRKFIGDVSQLNRVKKYFFANNIESIFTELINEFEGCMNSLNFSFSVQSRNEIMIIKTEIRQLSELILNIHGVPDTTQSKQDFFNEIGLVTKKNKYFQEQNIYNIEFQNSVEEIEPLLEGQFQKTNVVRSKKIEKRIAYNDFSEYCFKEFSDNSSSLSMNQSNTQIEIRLQVNILKELKNSKHIIKFFGVAQENSKFYLVTEWMEFGNLNEYYTNYRENMNWKTKVRFALGICRGISYLNDCKILHHDIRSENILINYDHEVKIANFGLSKKFSEFTRNISHNIENVRYMAPEKLLIEEGLSHDIKRKKQKFSNNYICIFYSVGALLWEIAELKKPHSDINNTEMLISIRERVRKRYHEPLSDDVPDIWKFIVKRCEWNDFKKHILILNINLNFFQFQLSYGT
ncbi:kinase-like domain-containing protein, partial [Glomus cerebriforme]